MKTTINRKLALGLGAAALCASALPAAAVSFTQPGATTGVPAGVNPPPGLYFGNSANYGIGGSLSPAPSPSTSVGIEIPFFIWSPGWNFLGATYAASVAFPLVEIGTHNANYLRGPFNPVINPVQLSWNLGNGFAISVGEDIYIPIASDVVFAGAGVTSGASFEQRVAVSYIGNDWIASVNGIVGIATKDSNGVQLPDYVDVDATLAHTFGKWELGAIAYYSADINGGPGNPTFFNAGGKALEVGFGGLLGYNFGVVDLTLKLTHEFVSEGITAYGHHDTRVWSTIVIPIWNPTPPAPVRPVVAKY
jgi:hypothetical protein